MVAMAGVSITCWSRWRRLMKRTCATVGEMNATERIATKTASLAVNRSEEHTTELQSLIRKSYSVFCLKKKKKKNLKRRIRHQIHHKQKTHNSKIKIDNRQI